jgi:hypothetical protein
MPNNEFAVTISGDASPLKDATDAAKEHLKEAGDSVDMLGDLIGVKVPEGISKMLAATELIGPALEAAFIPLSVITLGVAIFDLTEKLKQQREELEKTKTETLNEALAVNQYANALQTNTLKLQDQLAVLQKKPATNGIKIAMDEGRKATSDLVDEFTKAIDKLDELLQKQKQGFWDRLMNGDNGSNDVIAKAHDFKTEIDDIAQQMQTAAALGHKKEADDYKAQLDKKQTEFRAYIAKQQEILASRKASSIDTLTKSGESVASGPNGETEAREALSLADATKQVNEQFRDEQRNLNELTIYSQSYATASAQVAKNNSLNNQIAAAEAQKNKAAFEQAQKDKVSIVDRATKAMVEIDEKGNQQALTSDFSAIKAENDAFIKDVNERIKIWDEIYKGEIDKAKGKSAVKIQLIEQEFVQGKITQQQEIAAIAKEKEDELALEVLYQKKRQALWEGDKNKVQEIENQILKIKANSDAIAAKAQTDSMKLQEKNIDQVFSKIKSGMDQTIRGMLTGTENFSKAWQQMWSGMVVSMAEKLADMMLKWVEHHVSLLIVHATEKEQEVASEAAASAQSKSISLADSLAKIQHNAASAASGVYQAESYLGPVIAGLMAAGTYTAVLGFGAMASAEGGQYYVPNNQLTMLHPQEMVLPAGIANQMRSVIGGGSGGGGTTVIVNHSVNAVDAASFQQHIRRHSNMIANEVTRALKRKA